jgi:VacB/RNase II family 3'-5' exoribonuclease
MTNDDATQHRILLQKIARRAMLERGMLPDFSPAALAELNAIRMPALSAGPSTRDLQNLLWCSIDNDDSYDLDQLTVAESLSGDGVKVLVAIADVDALVKINSALDQHARHNTTSIYTDAQTFPMLPEKLSSDLTSLKYASDRSAVVIEMIISKEGSLQNADVYGARVRNQAKLAYNSVAAWLDGNGPMPPAIGAVPGLAENIRLQDLVAQKMKTFRHDHGALTLETVEARLVFDDGTLLDVEPETKNRAKDIIEDFMIAANGVTARYLDAKKMPSLRRVVRTPKRWDRIMELASDHRFKLPVTPESKALEAFLAQAKAADPLRFPDLSVSVIKLLGAGEYVVLQPGAKPYGHFGLAVRDYSHSTAPNRRYPDIISQRLLKSALGGHPLPYKGDELEELAKHCTEKEDDAKKIERRVRKSAAALLLEDRIGEHFDAIVTGAADKGTWVRLLNPPIEGRLARGFEGMDVGIRLRVELISVDVERGYIDFKRTP